MKKNREFEDTEFEYTSGIENNSKLILYNDDYHDFEDVINTLVDVCRHTPIQAEQCTYIAHYKGRCDVKEGRYKDLKSMKEELINKGFQAELN